ncbi:phage holin family protein [Haloterrigena salifodinae]|uniref:Phage holin family protein n=1 Tax=Haloterrigena salifodinae TaxID=2675099 RepID=A0A8T8DV99_9EURY|nr:phage holin family protein [Haloterrigena salifodinae]QRV13424.1 phage holin family protein [Haloterrigena salifodinae]
MTRREWLVVVLGIAFVVAGLLFGLEAQPAWAWTASVAFGVFVLALVAVAVGGAKIRGALDTTADAPPVSWAPGDSFAAPTPERSDPTPELSSDEVASVIERAGERARHRETVEDGLEVVRPPLREALGEALVAGGQSREAVKATLADGSWTDDRLAASVLEPSINPPDRPFRERIRAWLFPERVARDRSRRATGAIAEAADEALPSVPGQSAPRTKPVLQPRLEELRRGADGRLQRAVDPTATVRGPRPPRPRLVSDDADSSTESGAGPPEVDGPDGKREVADR